MGAIEHGGWVALVAALAGVVVVGKWSYGKFEHDASMGERVVAAFVMVLILSVIVIIAVAAISANSGS
jgi:hypothetical protein